MAAGGRVPLEVCATLKCRVGTYVVALGQHPGERELPRRHAVASRMVVS